MQILVSTLQVIIALGIANVWLLRFGQTTAWRGGNARNMREEFAVYGLPAWFMYLIGTLKLSLAMLLMVGLFTPEVTRWAALGMAALMTGSLAMHMKVRDPIQKSVPAIAMLSMSAVVAASAG